MQLGLKTFQIPVNMIFKEILKIPEIAVEVHFNISLIHSKNIFLMHYLKGNFTSRRTNLI